MAEAQKITTNELEQFIEHKILEIMGDPDSGLQYGQKA